MNPAIAIAEAESLRTMDKEHVWHPLMNHSGMEENPLDIVVKAKGSTIQDASGKEYIDAMAGLWCVNIGYGRDEVARAAYEQMLELAYYPLTQVNPACGQARRASRFPAARGGRAHLVRELGLRSRGHRHQAGPRLWTSERREAV